MTDSGARILLVDDEEAILKLLRFPLEKEGYHVVTAKDGAEALQTFARESFDLVILDLMMPEVDGMEVCRRIRASGRFGRAYGKLETWLHDPDHAVAVEELLEDLAPSQKGVRNRFAKHPAGRSGNGS